ncbi:tail fiber protein [Rhizobium rhizogenes]|uniref:Tail fiber protein n=1 Tax=Rhizobium rhizogenes TaxID=359 RepID=A0AA92C5F7_RHIRH|nr:tail fiber protein [Rhizobium rhizogenes]PVE56298.1 hypothetical protein DC430_00340 [Rhizobium rhizogenes]PVE64793.1 hypothetical protein DC415_13540 [Agrobacterium tumefaciens]PVE73931.1 hypothetical protein DCP16_13540 [Sphingomonas sp. TPD3009]
MLDQSNDYQLPSWPPTKITREIWNSVLGDIGLRLRNRETLEASFELLQQEGIQAALDYIQVSIAPQLSDLQRTIQESKEQIDDLLQGNAPNAHRLGGQLPAFYAKASDVLSLLQVVEDKADADDVTALIQQRIAALVDSSPATLDTLKELAAALGNDANFSVTVTNALADLEIKIKQAGAPIGTTIMMQGNGNTPPPGYLLHNGAPCTSAYPQLRAWLLANGAAVNGNGDPIIEDMGGYFPRGWRSGQVVDSGRVFGSMQQDAFQNHRHPANRVSNATVSVPVNNNQQGPCPYIADGYVNVPMAQANGHGASLTDGDSGTPRTGAETRPVNKTFTYWIKAYAADQVPGSVDFAALANNLSALLMKVNALEAKATPWVSALQNVVFNSTITLGHGLGVRPTTLQLFLECVTAESGYSPGERVPVGYHFNGFSETGRGVQVYASSSNIVIVSGVNGVWIMSAASRVQFQVTPANWRYVAVAKV